MSALVHAAHQPGQKTRKVSVDEALAFIMAELKPLAGRTVPVLTALGWPLAEATVASIDMPRFDASAMDGYAVCSRDTADGPVVLALTAPVPAGF